MGADPFHEKKERRNQRSDRISAPQSQICRRQEIQKQNNERRQIAGGDATETVCFVNWFLIDIPMVNEDIGQERV